MPIEELFDLMELFPEQRLLPDSAEAATAELFAWARANPTLARRYPIASALGWARYMVGKQRLRAIESPLTGTYQMTVSLSGGPARTLYARTRGVPHSEWNSNGSLRRQVDDPTIVPRPDGYYLLGSRHPDALQDCGVTLSISRRGTTSSRRLELAIVRQLSYISPWR